MRKQGKLLTKVFRGRWLVRKYCFFFTSPTGELTFFWNFVFNITGKTFPIFFFAATGWKLGVLGFSSLTSSFFFQPQLGVSSCHDLWGYHPPKRRRLLSAWEHIRTEIQDDKRARWGSKMNLLAGSLVGPWVFWGSEVLKLPPFFLGFSSIYLWYFDGRISEIHNACCLGWFYFVTPVVVVSRW